MRRIDASGVPSPAAAQQVERHRAPDEGAHGHPADVGPELGMRNRFGNSGAGGDDMLDRRGIDFMARLQKALGEENGDDPEEDAGFVGKLLAVAGGPAPAGPATILAASALPSAPHPAGPAARMETIAARIEAAIGTAERSRGGEISLRLDFGKEAESIVGATIRMRPGVLEVVLTCRPEGQGCGIAAAQALADRLKTRFGGRVVRILQEEQARPSASGMGGVSRLLGAGRGRP